MSEQIWSMRDGFVFYFDDPVGESWKQFVDRFAECMVIEIFEISIVLSVSGFFPGGVLHDPDTMEIEIFSDPELLFGTDHPITLYSSHRTRIDL